MGRFPCRFSTAQIMERLDTGTVHVLVKNGAGNDRFACLLLRFPFRADMARSPARDPGRNGDGTWGKARLPANSNLYERKRLWQRLEASISLSMRTLFHQLSPKPKPQPKIRRMRIKRLSKLLSKCLPASPKCQMLPQARDSSCA